MMDMFDEYAQVICLAGPPVENFCAPKLACELAKIANDEQAALVARYPDRFKGFIACLPMNDIDGTLRTRLNMSLASGSTSTMRS